MVRLLCPQAGGQRTKVSRGAGERKRVLMLSWEFPPRIVGGIARHVGELSRALAEAGVEVDVVTAHHPGSPTAESIRAGRGRVRVLRAGSSPINALDFVCEIHQLDFGLMERLLGDGEFRYDLVHAHDWLVAFAARTLRGAFGVPVVATIHGTESGRNQGIHSPIQHYIHSVEWLLTYDASRVICCSRFMADEVARVLRVPWDKVRVVPNGVDPARLACDDTPEELAAFRERWAGREERIVMFVGRLVREKGVEVLIDAMPEVLAAHPDVKLVVAGGGWHGDLWSRAAGKGLGDNVVFTGYLPEEDLPRLYATADLAVFPSLYEPFGIVALEAMAAGVPVVTSDIGGFREAVRHGVTGIHTWANNPHSLAWGMNLVLSDAGLATRLREEGRREVGRRFSWREMAARTSAVYEEVLGEEEAGAVRRGVELTMPGVRPRYLGAKESASRS
jgi:glycogen(starch) synthase